MKKSRFHLVDSKPFAVGITQGPRSEVFETFDQTLTFPTSAKSSRVWARGFVSSVAVHFYYIRVDSQVDFNSDVDSGVDCSLSNNHTKSFAMSNPTKILPHLSQSSALEILTTWVEIGTDHIEQDLEDAGFTNVPDDDKLVKCLTDQVGYYKAKLAEIYNRCHDCAEQRAYENADNDLCDHCGVRNRSVCDTECTEQHMVCEACVKGECTRCSDTWCASCNTCAKCGLHVCDADDVDLCTFCAIPDDKDGNPICEYCGVYNDTVNNIQCDKKHMVCESCLRGVCARCGDEWCKQCDKCFQCDAHICDVPDDECEELCYTCAKKRDAKVVKDRMDAADALDAKRAKDNKKDEEDEDIPDDAFEEDEDEDDMLKRVADRVDLEVKERTKRDVLKHVAAMADIEAKLETNRWCAGCETDMKFYPPPQRADINKDYCIGCTMARVETQERIAAAQLDLKQRFRRAHTTKLQEVEDAAKARAPKRKHIRRSCSECDMDMSLYPPKADDEDSDSDYCEPCLVKIDARVVRFRRRLAKRTKARLEKGTKKIKTAS